MTQILDIRTSASDDLTTLVSDGDTLGEHDGPTEQWNPHRYETTLRLVDTADVSALVSDIETALGSADWATVAYRHTRDEYDAAEYRDSAEYAHPDDDLVTPVELSFANDLTVRVTAAYRHEGSVYTVDDTLTVTQPDSGLTRHTVTGDADGVALDGTGVDLGTVISKAALERLPRSGLRPREYPDPAAASEVLLELGTEPEPQPVAKRIDQLEQATGKNGEGKRGIAHRIDDIEDRLSQLEGQ